MLNGTMSYDEAEQKPDITLAQWARAQALQALVVAGHLNPSGAELMVNAYAELIISGSMPEPPIGMRW